MTITQPLLNEGQKMIYGRKRILDTFYKTHPVGKDIMEEDINGISFDDDYVLLHVENKNLRIKKSDVIRNFWEHRPRTPSYFDYRIWRQRPLEGGVPKEHPVCAVDHNANVNQLLNTDIRTKTDKDGTKRIYLVTPGLEEPKTCTCGSFNQMKENQLELSLEFKKYCPDIEFRPICKHIQWYIRYSWLFMDMQVIKRRYKNNPRACTYFYDHTKRKILYKITENIYKSDVGWIPAEGWKEKAVCDPSGMPTGNCWSVLEGALCQEPPYSLHPYSKQVEYMVNRSSYPKSRY